MKYNDEEKKKAEEAVKELIEESKMTPGEKLQKGLEMLNMLLDSERCKVRGLIDNVNHYQRIVRDHQQMQWIWIAWTGLLACASSIAAIFMNN